MATTCFDIRRIDDDHVCVYRAAHDTFEYSYHIPTSSYSKRVDEDRNGKYVYDYIIVGKDSTCGDIETIIFSCSDKNHTYEVLQGCITGDGIFYHESMHDYRIIRFPMYKRHGKYAQTTNILHDSVRLYCPIKLNRKYKIYGTYSDKRKIKGGCYFKQPRRIRGINRG